MATNAAAWASAVDNWTVLSVHDWQGVEDLESTLVRSLGDLADAPDGVLYDHVDVECLVGVLSPTEGRGAGEVRFQYGPYEVRIEQDGRIAVR